MAFKTRTNIETAAQEVARLADAPAGSQNRELSELPVNIPVIALGQLIKLPAPNTKEGETVIVTPITCHTTSPAQGQLRLRHRATWDCRVVGGDSQVYAPGGWDICLPEAALVRGELIKI